MSAFKRFGSAGARHDGPVDPPTHGPHVDSEFHHGHSHAASSCHPGSHHLLSVEGLDVSFSMYDAAGSYWSARKVLQTQLHDLSLSVHVGEILAVVGASGSGKTLLADALLGLYEPNALVRGTVWFDGERVDAAAVCRLRGHGISLVPQSVSHLDPLMRVGEQVMGACRGSERPLRRKRMRALFERYGLAPETERLFPFELSGGMARRVLLMCALMDDPKLIIADEPTPGLDVDLAVRALDDLRAFADDGGGVLLITHDIELALRTADRIAVFRDGTVVEETAVSSFESPDLLRTPYARALWHAMPAHGMRIAVEDAAGGCGREAS